MAIGETVVFLSGIVLGCIVAGSVAYRWGYEAGQREASSERRRVFWGGRLAVKPAERN